MAGLEFRPEWDRALGVYRLPFTLFLGTDTFQIFAGPAITIGEAALGFSGGDRRYSPWFTWLGDLGISFALPPLKIGRGALSVYGELAWQPYHWKEGENFTLWPDLTANLRASTGLRYFWHLGR
jgi:hypothetical protein